MMSASASAIPSTSTFTQPTSLCPGYKQVDAFNSSGDYYSDDDEEDVSYITLDLGSIEPTLVPSSSTYRLIGLDTPTPFLQLSGTILKGRHDSLLGSELLFTDEKDVDKTKRSITFTGSTSQRISFREVQLVPKGASVSSPSSPLNGKSRGKGKGKGKAGERDDGLESAVARDPQMVDRITGKVAPRARALSGKRAKGKTGSDEEAEGDAEEMKPKLKVTGKERAKQKGKAKTKEKEKDALDEDNDGMDVYEG